MNVSNSHDLPRVAVLLATCNGRLFIEQQVACLLDQRSCNPEIWVSDDQSTDGTWEWLVAKALNEPRLLLLPRTQRYGSAARNFFRLLSDVDLSNYSYAAFSDQDDIWFEEKLALSIEKIRLHDVVAFSSDVCVVWPDGRRNLIRKSQPQRPLDYLFESAGQGCTYTFTADCAIGFQKFLALHRQQIDLVHFHDWMLYAWCRAQDLGWHIEPTPTVLYRQHDTNVQGASVGFRAMVRRMKKVRSGWYRREILMISRLIQKSAVLTPICSDTIRLLEVITPVARIILALRVGKFRRRLKDRLLLVIAFLSGTF